MTTPAPASATPSTRADAPRLGVPYELKGPATAPVVAVLGGISADRHVAAERDQPGWWPAMVGRGRPVDLRRFRVLSVDYLGSASADAHAAGAAADGGRPKTRRAASASGRADVPLITPADQAAALAAVVDGLGLPRLHGVIGASYGGAVALALAASHPRLARGALVIGAAERSHPMATAVRAVQRRILRDGVARGDEAGALALARALAMTTYRSDVEFEQRFAGPPAFEEAGPRFPVEEYLEHTGAAFARRSSARAFLCLSQSLDLHDVDPASIRIPLTLVSIHPDSIAPRWQVERLAARVPGPCRLVRVDSPRGHDAFLTDHDVFASVITDFLAAPEIRA